MEITLSKGPGSLIRLLLLLLMRLRLLMCIMMNLMGRQLIVRLGRLGMRAVPLWTTINACLEVAIGYLAIPVALLMFAPLRAVMWLLMGFLVSCTVTMAAEVGLLWRSSSRSIVAIHDLREALSTPFKLT